MKSRNLMFLFIHMIKENIITKKKKNSEILNHKKVFYLYNKLHYCLSDSFYKIFIYLLRYISIWRKTAFLINLIFKSYDN